MSDRNEDRGRVAQVQGEGVATTPLHESLLSGATALEEITNRAGETPSATAEAPVRIGSQGDDESTAEAISGAP